MYSLGRYIVIFILFWIILAEKMNLETLCVGLSIVLLVYCFNKYDIILTTKKESKKLQKLYYWFVYLFMLVKEIILANFEVAKIVLSPRMNISPEFVEFDTKLRFDIHKTILANSITLTPGTLTVLMEENTLVVHCLQKDYVEHILNSKFEQILLKIEE